MSLVKCRIEAKVLLRTILVVCKLLTEGQIAAKHRSVLQMDIISVLMSARHEPGNTSVLR